MFCPRAGAARETRNARSPHRAIDGFATEVGDRVVVPRGERNSWLFSAHVGKAFRDDSANLRVGDHVHPRCRRRLAGGQNHHVLAAVVAETAQAVKKRQIARRGSYRMAGSGRPRSGFSCGIKTSIRPPLGLFGQRSAVIH